MSIENEANDASAGPSSLTPALFKRLHPKPYLERFLQERLRPDGRPLDDEHAAWRDASINIGSIATAPSSALVRLGKTTVVCGITLEIAPPDMATPTHGFIGGSRQDRRECSYLLRCSTYRSYPFPKISVPNIDLPPLCSSLFRPGPPADEAQVLSSRLRDTLLSSNYVPLDSLCIEPSKAAWVIYLDLICLNYDGSVLDASVLAAVAAIRNLKLPQATWDVDTLSTICEPISDEQPGRALQLAETIPLTLSFGLYEELVPVLRQRLSDPQKLTEKPLHTDSDLLPDPTLFESQLCTSQISITVSSSSLRLLQVQQSGATGSKSSVEILKASLGQARTRAKQLLVLLNSS
ncbi:BZ3500_MvSof-1268-A1-R1_Chr5-2g08106 [Microbotryum saponariae]|uniref:Ribosomal RNA-processing protein 43 n=1 Tax=Microbotryum saponariae TaxID=289078 RepID=A0A2X0KLK8_9BASI|nr:BZ3500_MvSof-1268-A1-R1_Chr5-2g08106 [Microbotryum saponariae]SDA05975.1 BZ3501_MvSof-1269-A2-R1_Chr5-2g07928 [Microbotryum saponariae]